MESVTGMHELEMLSFDWSMQKPGLALTFSTLCCASGTCDDYVTNLDFRLEDFKKIVITHDGKNAYAIRKTIGSLR